MRPGSGNVFGQTSRKTPLIEVITHAIDSHRALASDCRVELAAEVSPRLVLVEAGPMYPAISNAIRNAIESISRSGLGSRVELVAELETCDGETPQIVIDVVDDGPGLDAQTQRHAF